MLYNFDMFNHISAMRTFFIFTVLFIILGAIYLIFLLLTHFTKNRPTKNRLALIEAISLDSKKKLVLVKCDEKEYLILLAPSGDILLKSIQKD
ncbi:flagellar biosynthetic protein FliO [Bartonella sp. TP]|uniref:flagellar biosynthetic protein FliO n=1 Tax=Bartonella sp. TP TaxID=3057550 RepID=UPI00263F442C|nr:flagellar biosynthetic protein FliO [Alphaproteobacteria bacterium]